MGPRVLYRLAGASVAVGCLVVGLGDLIRMVAGTDPANPLLAAGWFMEALGSMLVVFGLPAIYLRQATAAGITGLISLIGFNVFFFLFGIFGGLVHTLIVPALAARAPALAQRPGAVGLTFLIGTVFVLIGCVALGIATFRAAVHPRAVGVLVIAGGVLVIIGHPVGYHVDDAGLLLILGGLGWLGTRLLAGRGAAGGTERQGATQ